MPKNLQKQIETKLEKLQKLLEQITEAQTIDPNDPETWDSDTLYNLAEQLKETLQILEGKKAFNKYGQELSLTEGLCSLIDTYQSGEEENDV